MAPLRKLAVLPLAAGFSPSLFDPIRVSDRSGDMSFFRSTDPFFDDFGMLSMRKGLLFDRAMRAEQVCSSAPEWCHQRANNWTHA